MKDGEESEIDLKSYIEDKQARVNAALDRILPRDDEYPQALSRAMRYTVLGGGKRFRPVLCIASFEGCGGTGDAIMPVACAIELIHAYSLIHDDLPCMDNDDLRRGRPTAHKVFGEAVAVLAGDALLTFAVETVLTEATRGLDGRRVTRILNDLMKAAGHRGMVAGQVVDMESQGREGNAETVKYIHTHKTGALIASAARCGAIGAGAIESVVERMATYGSRVGLAFQIIDDVLDAEGKFAGVKSASRLDERTEKITYPAIFGVEASRTAARQLIEEAKQAILSLGPAAEPLGLLADLVGSRSS